MGTCMIRGCCQSAIFKNPDKVRERDGGWERGREGVGV